MFNVQNVALSKEGNLMCCSEVGRAECRAKIPAENLLMKKMGLKFQQGFFLIENKINSTAVNYSYI